MAKKSRSQKPAGVKQRRNEENRDKNKVRKMIKKEVYDASASTTPWAVGMY